MGDKEAINEDKKDIEREERETMLNEVNKVQETPQESEVKEISKLNKDDIKEGREVKPKKIPIGGIQMPGFFTRSKSKEKCKDGESETGTEDTEGIELLEEPPNKEDDKEKMTRIKLPNPFNKKNNKGEEDKVQDGKRKSLIDTIRIPLVSVFPRKSKQSDAQNLASQSGAAGLASMETLDDDKSHNKGDGEMKNVKLDDDKVPIEKQESEEELSCATKIRSYRVVISALLLFILAVIIILSLIIPGQDKPTLPIRDGKYAMTVTQCGPVEGILEDGAYTFRGIPYALPPTGENRWKPAQPLDSIEYCWNGTFEAYDNVDVCPQLGADMKLQGTEDCLTLDVVTPYVRYENPLPVIVLIGSESLMGSSPGKMRPSGRYTRARDVVFVRPNFRIGVLGFLSLELLSKNTHLPSSGNYGLSDIIEALRWIQRNIEHFGGDKDQVTLFGHRAGATLVTALTTIEKANKLFAKAWATSGSTIFPGKDLPESESANKKYLDSVKCNDLNCLLGLTPEKLTDAVIDNWRKPPFDLPEPDENINERHEWLVLDGNILKTHPATIWTTQELPVKLVLGTTAHAAASDYLIERHSPWTPELVKNHISNSLLGEKNLTEEVLSRYPATYQGLIALVSDIRIVCPIYAMSVQQRGVPFYVVGQTHGPHEIADIDSDVDAILGRYEPRSPEQRRYVAAMQQLFYHFVGHGEVLQSKHATKKTLEVAQDANPISNYTNCDFWIAKNIVPKYAQLD